MHRILSTIHIIVVLAIPLGILAVAGFGQHIFFSLGETIDTIAAFIYWLMAMPVLAVYAAIALNRFFPTSLAGQLRILGVICVTTITNIVLIADIQAILASIVIQAASFYIGLYICLIVGLCILVARKAKIHRHIALRILVFTIIISPIGFTLYYAWMIGYSALVENGYSLWSIIVYSAEILFIALNYYPQYVKLYIEGKL